MPESRTPERMTVTDLDSDEEPMVVMFNPTEIRRKIAVNYARKGVLGNSHMEHEYLQTANQSLTFSLFWLVESERDLDHAEDAMKFIESLCYAPNDPQSLARASPPRVLIVWPRTLSMTCRLINVEFNHQRFNIFGNTVQYTARCTWDEAAIRRITKQDVRDQGALRTPRGIVDIDSEDPIITTTGSDGQIDIDGDIEIVFE